MCSTWGRSIRLPQRRFLFNLPRLFVAIGLLLSLFSFSGCTITVPGGTTGPSKTPVVAYCPYLPSNTYSSPITVNGSAFYEFRVNGNGPVSDSIHTITPSSTTQSDGTTYGFTVSGTAINFVCPSSCTQSTAVTGLVSAVNNTSAAKVTATASGSSAITLTPKNKGDAITITGATLVTDTPDAYSSPNNVTHPDPNPIRFAEVQVTDSSGAIVQCAETTNSGSFSFQLPSGGATYTVSVMSRSNNSSNTAYVLSDPYNNTVYKISTTVTASGSPTPRLVATVSTTGGAFNILDQIYKAQYFMRTTTAGCSGTYSDCNPFVSAPRVTVFWTLGLTPSTYSGGTGGISFYGSPDGTDSMRGLYILGGINGDVDKSDMDHFDNSVIIHEYGHFIEDNYSKMDSPGGSHNGNSIIDPRLAWGEGWADFFQGVVLSYYTDKNGGAACGGSGCGNGYYRDTYGRVGCTGSNSQGLPGCTGASFNEDLSVDPTSCSGCHDQPTTSSPGEGNFREFSVARIMYRALRNGGTPVSVFSEVWTAVNGTSSGMKPTTERFKGIGRFHTIEIATSNMAKWSSLRSNEQHYGDVGDYSTPFLTTGCASTSKAMAIKVKCTASDDGSFSQSDLFRNNDFYYYAHPGGSLNLSLTWSGAGNADLDLYVYPQGYIYGSNWSATSRADSNTTSGTESISTSLAAGNYMINVMAYTGKVDSSHPLAPYTNPSCASPLTANTTYNLTINSSPLCPTYTKDSARP